MLQALLHGKLSHEIEGMEDVLTSSVFGILKYIPPEKGLIPFLQCAIPYPPDEDSLIDISDIEDIEYDFWPWLEIEGYYGCEPDIIIKLKLANNKNLLILIEAKYQSGKSSEADEKYKSPTDQLAREWVSLESICKKNNSIPILIYLTAGVGFPRNDIQSSLSELKLKVPQSKPNIYWLSWRHLYSLCMQTEHMMLNDLKMLLERLELKFFNGWNFSTEIISSDWYFTRPPINFDWKINIFDIGRTWRYSA